MLAEVFRNSAPRSICQAELCENYDHKHQELSPRDPEKGLNRMAVDIMRSIFRRMASEGIKLDQGLLKPSNSPTHDKLRTLCVPTARMRR